jgi:hypothetical protein
MATALNRLLPERIPEKKSGTADLRYIRRRATETTALH